MILKALSLSLILFGCSQQIERVVIFDAEPGEYLTLGTKILNITSSVTDIESDGQIITEISTPEILQERYALTLTNMPEKASKFILYFVSGETKLNSEEEESIINILAEVQRRRAVEVQITGHTDQTGDSADNDKLSIERATVVYKVLKQHGLATQFVRVIGRGAREPLIDTPGQAEDKNRRVEILIR